MEVEGVPVCDIRLVERQGEDDLFGILIVGGKDILARSVQRIVMAVDDLVTHLYTFVVVFVCTVGEYFRVEIHLGKQCVSCPFVESAIIFASHLLGKQRNILFQFFDDKLIDLLSRTLLGQESLRHVKLGDDGDIAEEIVEQIVVGSAQHFEFCHHALLAIAEFYLSGLYLIEHTVARVDTVVGAHPTIERYFVLAGPLVLVHTFIHTAVDPPVWSCGNHILIGAEHFRSCHTIPQKHRLAPGDIGRREQ